MALLAIVVIAAGVGLASYVYSGNHAGSADASATSSSTRMRMGGHGGPGQPAIVGTVESIDGDTLTVVGHQGFVGGPRMASSTITTQPAQPPTTNFATTTYTVDATNAKISKISTSTPPSLTNDPSMDATSSRPMPTTISIAQIQVGDRVMIQGTVSGTSVSATNIMDGIPMGGRGHGGFGGPGPGGRGEGDRNGWNASSTMPAQNDIDAPPQQ